MINHADVVRRIKDQLVARGEDLSGPCGAFKIVKRVAWALRSEGAGLLSKPSGNNCEGYATDIIAYPDGMIYDCLGDGGGANNPQWPDDGEQVEASRYRPAIDPGDGESLPGDPPVPPIPPTTNPTDLTPILKRLDEVDVALDLLLGSLEDHDKSLSALKGLLQSIYDRQDRRYTGNTKAFGGAVELTPRT